jgi:hypothetical protein
VPPSQGIFAINQWTRTIPHAGRGDHLPAEDHRLGAGPAAPHPAAGGDGSDRRGPPFGRLIHFPLKAGHAWAWWILLLSNVAGFCSFLTYLGFGYLDAWHGLATLALLPCFVIGLCLKYRDLPGPRSIACLWQRRLPWPLRTAAERGQWLMLGTGSGLFAAGCTITTVGMTVVFVPQDLEYMRTTLAILNAINPHLIPLIAHDRAGFGSGVLNVGYLVLAITWCARPSRSRWQV